MASEYSVKVVWIIFMMLYVVILVFEMCYSVTIHFPSCSLEESHTALERG